MMFDDLVKEPTVNVSEEEAAIVKALIAGEPSRVPYVQRSPLGLLLTFRRHLADKRFLFDIVANKRNGLDVDKYAYMHNSMENADRNPGSITLRGTAMPLGKARWFR